MSAGKRYKESHILNWKEYNQALVNRGSLTFWFPEDVGRLWFSHEPKHGRGCFKTYSDAAMQMALMVKAVFKLPLRGLEGFLNSVFKLLGLRLTSPDYSLFSKRARSLEVAIPRRLSGEAIDVMVDGSGLKIYGEGEGRRCANTGPLGGVPGANCTWRSTRRIGTTSRWN